MKSENYDNGYPLNITLQEEINSHIGDQFKTPEEVIKAGLTLLEERKKRLDDLKSAIQAGRESGYIENFDWNDHRRKMLAKHSLNSEQL